MESATVRTVFARQPEGYRGESSELSVCVDGAWIPRTKKGWSPQAIRAAELVSWTMSLAATACAVLVAAPFVVYGLLISWVIFTDKVVPTLAEDVELSPRWRAPQARVLQLKGRLENVRIQADGDEYEVAATVEGKQERLATCLSHAEALTLSSACAGGHDMDRASLA
ncbi:MAG: hypothetical protein AB8H86_18980 [Polyangiales bacterium]